MKKQAFNPYLPSWEYVPDGEPYVFGDRVYVYGSHDYYNGYVFCMGDYGGATMRLARPGTLFDNTHVISKHTKSIPIFP